MLVTSSVHMLATTTEATESNVCEVFKDWAGKDRLSEAAELAVNWDSLIGRKPLDATLEAPGVPNATVANGKLKAANPNPDPGCYPNLSHSTAVALIGICCRCR